jgi:L-aspartate oxidase
MGGVATDIWGRTTLEGLWAVGECASTGAHGANRLASNSLLESVVFANRIAERLSCEEAPPPTAFEPVGAPPVLPTAAHLELRQIMQTHAGVLRHSDGLRMALDRIDVLCEAHGEANPLIAARFIVAAALDRKESRGAHFRSDFPHAIAPRRTFLTHTDSTAAAAA